jgi:hypothetical protein
LIEELRGNNPDVRAQAAFAVPGILKALQNNQSQFQAPSQQLRLVAVFALVSVGVGLEEIAKQISPEEAKPLLSTFTSTLQVLPKQILQLPPQAINSLPNPLGQSALPQPTSLPQKQSR